MTTLDERLEQEETTDDDVILFYRPQKSPWGIFSNFTPTHIVMTNPFNGKSHLYYSGEHRFQAMKATTAKDHNYVSTADGPGEAKRRGGPKGILLRDGWGNSYGDLCYYVMLELVMARAIQNHKFRDILMRTGEKFIAEDSPTDDIWGWRYEQDYSGKNLLGRCLMDVRDDLLIVAKRGV